MAPSWKRYGERTSNLHFIASLWATAHSERMILQVQTGLRCKENGYQNKTISRDRRGEKEFLNSYQHHCRSPSPSTAAAVLHHFRSIRPHRVVPFQISSGSRGADLTMEEQRIVSANPGMIGSQSKHGRQREGKQSVSAKYTSAHNHSRSYRPAVSP